MAADERHPKNARGPFYVLDDSCISCGAPEAEAPSLIGSCKNGEGCYFRKQPTTPEEENQAIRAMLVSCV